MGNTDVVSSTKKQTPPPIVIAKNDAGSETKKPKLKVAKEAKEPKEVPTVYGRCFKQFDVWRKKNKKSGSDLETIKQFIVDCRNGYPTGRPKTVESLRLKYRGIVHTLKSMDESLSYPPSSEILGG